MIISRNAWFTFLSLILATTSLGACGKKVPTGQVVAVVNGEEVTRRDLSAEPQAAALPEGGDGQPALGTVLNGVIDRKLAAAEARRLELDHTPQYVAMAKRLDEVMLSRTLFDRWASEMPKPSRTAMAAYVKRNPQRFAGRKLFLVDRIDTQMDPAQSQALAPLQTMDAVAAHLDARSQAYQRGRNVIDSATVTLPFYRKLTALRPGYPLALIQGGQVAVLSVIEARDAALPTAAQSVEAIKALKQEAVQQKLANLRKGTEISFQPGYRPKAFSQPSE